MNSEEDKNFERMMLHRIRKPLSIIFLFSVISSLYVYRNVYFKRFDLSVGSPELVNAEILKEEGDSRNIHHINKNLPTRYVIYSQQITYEDIETFHAELPPLLPQYKNPCWLEVVSKDYNYSNSYLSHCKHPPEAPQFDYMQNLLKERCQDDDPCWRLRCFPYFMSMGMQKSGTSSLYSTLTKYHPQIVRLSRKESQFWSRYRQGLNGCRREIRMTLADYLDSHDYQSEMIRSTDLGPVHGQIIGDYTPANAWLQHRWETWPGNENQNEPRVILPHHIYHINPRTKFIMNIRDPVDRYISNHYHDGNTESTLESSVIEAIQLFDNCTEKEPLRYCIYSIKDALCKGIYYVYVKDWMEVFPRKQFYFMLFDDFAEDPAKVVIEISDFLQLDPPPESAVEKLRSLPSRNKTHNPATTTVKLLQDFYRSWNKKLAAELKDDRFMWPY